MIKRSARYYLLSGIVLSFLALICFTSYALTGNLEKPKTTTEDLRYVSYEILTDNVMPVVKEEEQVVLNVMRPYTAGDVEIGKSYYNYKGDENNQEKSIVYYDNTYIQNQGTDYTSKTEFDVNAIENGKVLSVTTDDIVGTTVKIEHNDGLISIYQSLKDVIVKESEDVTRGQVIGKSGTNSISSELGNHLHFELYKDNVLVDPEEYFNNQGN